MLPFFTERVITFSENVNLKSTESVKTIDFKALRKQSGLTLEALAERTKYSVAAINGLENNGAGSKRLRTRVFEVLTSAIEGISSRAAVALANQTTGTQEEKQAAFEAAAEKLSGTAFQAKVAQRKLAKLRVHLTEMIAIIDGDDDDPTRTANKGQSKGTET